MNELPIEIDVHSVKELHDNQSIVLIDCRESDEYETAKIQGALLMPMSQWMQSVDKLSEFSDKRIVVHCHHGGRSLRVTNWLRENGFPQAQNMAGGIDAWSQQIDSTVPQY